jgi:outer membrane protein assembly factor BamB
MKVSCTTLLLLSTMSVAHAASDDWPQFRGPSGQGHATATGLPISWSETENIRWKVPIPGLGWSSPVVQGEQVWLTTAVEEDQTLRAICLDRETGKIVHNIVLLKQDLGRIAAKNSHASPTPIVEPGRIYVHFGAHLTACLSTAGKIIWTKELKYDQRHGPGGSPVVWKDLLIVSCDGIDVQYTVALDKQTGEERWKTEHPGQQAYSTPIVIKVNGVEQLITSGGEAAIAYSPKDGSELWRCRHGGHSVVPRPVAGNGLIYFCTGYWTPALFAVRPDGHGDVTDTKLEFTLRRGVPHTPSPLLIGDRLLMISDLGVLTCVDAKQGQEVWRQRVGGNFSASPTLADGKVYLTNETGATLVLEPGDKYQLLRANHVEGRTLASPAFAGHAIYLRTDSHLYRIEDGHGTRAETTSRREVLMGTVLR